VAKLHLPALYIYMILQVVGWMQADDLALWNELLLWYPKEVKNRCNLAESPKVNYGSRKLWHQ
jgi:hypothetical protein